jgi:NAD(P)-dependent dehydrogenase (short-subunit alcohol dehydrogenase family)
VDAVTESSDELHLLVNNAGVTWGASFDEFPEQGWDKVLGVNVKAPFLLTQACRPLLLAGARPGHPTRVINVGSIDGLTVPLFDNFSYSAAKAALHHLTRHLASALAPDILVNAIAPGPFPTKMMEKPLETIEDGLVKASPVGRIGQSQDMAGAALFLASPASSFVTGAVIPVDGGLSTTAGIRL